jgi:Ras-related protein Rab-7A
VLVYDITNPKSFDNLEVWKQDFLIKANPKNPENFPFFLFGNKSDKASERSVFIAYKFLIDCTFLDPH